MAVEEGPRFFRLTTTLSAQGNVLLLGSGCDLGYNRGYVGWDGCIIIGAGDLSEDTTPTHPDGMLYKARQHMRFFVHFQLI